MAHTQTTTVSAKSLRWLHENREKYAGLWVALDGDRLIASGPTAQEVYSKAKAEGVQIPFVELVSAQDSGSSDHLSSGRDWLYELSSPTLLLKPSDSRG
jgi:hypothetical protein